MKRKTLIAIYIATILFGWSGSLQAQTIRGSVFETSEHNNRQPLVGVNVY